MPCRKAVEIGSAREALAAEQSARLDAIRNLPDLPVLPETLLRLEIEMRERAVDLTEVSRLILLDLGAATQIMRLAGSEYNMADPRPRRVEEFLSDLGIEVCLEAMARRPATRSSLHPAVFGAWAHSREIAEICRSIAADASGQTDPVDAHLVGLFHAVEMLPVLLGWEQRLTVSKNQAILGLRIAEAWALPVCVLEYFSDRSKREPSGHWTDIVDRAHKSAGLPSAHRREVKGS